MFNKLQELAQNPLRVRDKPLRDGFAIAAGRRDRRCLPRPPAAMERVGVRSGQGLHRRGSPRKFGDGIGYGPKLAHEPIFEPTCWAPGKYIGNHRGFVAARFQSGAVAVVDQ